MNFITPSLLWLLGPVYAPPPMPMRQGSGYFDLPFTRARLPCLRTSPKGIGCRKQRLGLHDFRFQAGGKGHDFAALWFGHFKRIESDR